MRHDGFTAPLTTFPLLNIERTNTMKAILFAQFGAADVLKIGDAPDPVLRPTDLLVRTHAAGVNRADLTQPDTLFPVFGFEYVTEDHP